LLRRVLKYFIRALLLVLVFLSSALLAMRFAIQGREVRVPKLAGLTPIEAERVANSDGLVLSVESRFYSSNVPQGRIVSQSPAPDATVRKGWKVRVAESLGQQRAAVPNLIGESKLAAGINISRRGLEMGSVSTIHLPGAQPEVVVSQNPPPDATEAVSPKVDLILSASDNEKYYIMPNFVGSSLETATASLLKAGFVLGKVHSAASEEPASVSAAPGTIVRQSPAAGQKIPAGATISFEVKK
jgi:eukaryotic-like serine/threonine-protein kinase